MAWPTLVIRDQSRIQLFGLSPKWNGEWQLVLPLVLMAPAAFSLPFTALTPNSNSTSRHKRVYPRTPAKPVPCTALPASRVNPLPQDRGSPARAPDQAEAPNWPWRRSGAAGHWRLKDQTKKVTNETDSRIRLPQRHPYFIVRKIAQSLWVKLSSIRSQSWRNHCGSGFTREHRRSRCHAPRCLLRG